MTRLLFVDDDALLTRLYRERLSAHGFQVHTAANGSAAITFLRSAKPDLVVLDLLMPDLSGVDVLKFIRSESRLAPIPVVVLTNAYLNDLGRQVAAIGIDKAFLKSQCSPSVLMASIDEILRAKLASSEPEQAPGTAKGSSAIAVAESAPISQPAPSRASVAPAPAGAKAAAAAQPATQAPAAVPEKAPAGASVPASPAAVAATHLMTHGQAICADLRKLFQGLARSPAGSPDQKNPLQELYKKVHFLSAAGGLTENAQLTQMATVFEALLYVLMADPARIGPSVLRTLASLVDFVELLLSQLSTSRPGGPLSGKVLVVDDDAVSNHLVVGALQQAQLNPRSTEDPLVAWQWAHHEHFDLVLLDIEMPGLNGLELCKRLRTVPGYEKTPVIFVSVHNEFESRAKTSLSGGDDLIAKPILPMELAAKCVMHLLKSQMPALAKSPGT